METITLTQGNHTDILGRLDVLIRAGRVAVVPTDTVYGLVCDARNEQAVQKMFAVKKRPDEKAFPIFVKDIAMARRYGSISDAKARFLERVWPGALTAVFHHKEKLPAVLTGGGDTIGMRMPDHAFLLELLARLELPLAQTSANISGMPPAKTAAEVAAYSENSPDQPDLIIDGGTAPGISSAVIDCTGVSPLILRSGIVSKADIDRMFGGL